MATALAGSDRPAVLAQSIQLSKRAVLGIWRQPLALFPALFFPLFFLAVMAASFDRLTGQEAGFAAEFDSFLDFLLPATILQGIVFGTTEAGEAMATDIEGGFFDRLLASPVNRTSILVGRLAGVALLGAAQALFFTVVMMIFGAELKGGLGALAVLMLASALLSLAVGGFTATIAIRTGSAEAVQGAGPVVFMLPFTSSAFFPRDLMSGWYGTIATYNPVSWIVEAERRLASVEWTMADTATALGTAFAFAAAGIAFAQLALRRRLRVAT